MIYNRTTWENSPSTSTPINAQNLNKIEQGITDAATELNGLQPHLSNVGAEIDEDYRVNVIHSRNLFDKNNLKIAVYDYSTTGVVPPKVSSTTRCAIGPDVSIKVKPNTKYTFSSNNNIRVAIGELKGDKTLIQSASWTQNALTITTTANTEYIIFNIDYNNGATITSAIFTTIQNAIMFNEGETSLPYEPYIQNQIVVDNEKYSDTINVGQFDGRSRVNVLKSTNLFDASIQAGTYGTATYSVASDGLITQSATDSSSFNTNDARNFTLPAGTYTFSIIGKDSNVRFQLRNLTDSTNIFETTDNTYTFTLTETKKLALKTWSGAGAYPQNYYIMLNEGSTALPYEPYFEPSINVDNEMLVSKNVYSSNEVVIGEWLGKPLYRKVYSITSPSSANTDYENLTSLNIDRLVHLYGYYKRDTGTFGIPFHDSDENYSVMFLSSANRLRGRIANASGVADTKVIIEYTKTTD